MKAIAPPLTLDPIVIRGRMLFTALELLYPITKLPPNFAVAPFTCRSGAIAALNANTLALPIEPLRRTVAVTGLISYQRTPDTTPLATVCWVHSYSAFARLGFLASTAWVRRPSSVSISWLTPGWSALGGTV